MTGLEFCSIFDYRDKGDYQGGLLLLIVPTSIMAPLPCAAAGRTIIATAIEVVVTMTKE